MFITKKGLEEIIQKRLMEHEHEHEHEYQKNCELEYTFRRIADDYERLTKRVSKLEQEVWKPTPTTNEIVERTCVGI